MLQQNLALAQASYEHFLRVQKVLRVVQEKGVLLIQLFALCGVIRLKLIDFCENNKIFRWFFFVHFSNSDQFDKI